MSGRSKRAESGPHSNPEDKSCVFVNYLNRFGKYLRRQPRSRRPEKFRGRPTLEALEDRLVLSTATQTLSTLNITADPGAPNRVRTILLEADLKDHTKLVVPSAPGAPKGFRACAGVSMGLAGGITSRLILLAFHILSTIMRADVVPVRTVTSLSS